MIDPNEVVPEGTPPEIVAALSLVEGYGRDIAALKAKVAERAADLTEANAREERTALLAEGDDPRGVQLYEEMKAARVTAQLALERATAALKGARTAFHSAKLGHHRLTFAATVGRFTRLTNARAKAAQALQDAATAYERVLEGFTASNAKLANAFMATGARLFGVHLVDSDSLAQLIPFTASARHDLLALQYGLPGDLAEIIAGSNRVIIEAISAAPKNRGNRSMKFKGMTPGEHWVFAGLESQWQVNISDEFVRRFGAKRLFTCAT